MAEDYSELVQYLDGKFIKIDERFTGIDEKFTKIDERFTKIDEGFLDINVKFQRLEDKLDNKTDKSDFNQLLGAVDAYAKKADTYFQEMVMFSHQLKRHEKWIQQIADKLGVKLEY